MSSMASKFFISERLQVEVLATISFCLSWAWKERIVVKLQLAYGACTAEIKPMLCLALRGHIIMLTDFRLS